MIYTALCLSQCPSQILLMKYSFHYGYALTESRTRRNYDVINGCATLLLFWSHRFQQNLMETIGQALVQTCPMLVFCRAMYCSNSDNIQVLELIKSHFLKIFALFLLYVELFTYHLFVITISIYHLAEYRTTIEFAQVLQARTYSHRSATHFDVKLQRNRYIINPIFASLRLRDILQKEVWSDIHTTKMYIPMHSTQLTGCWPFLMRK